MAEKAKTKVLTAHELAAQSDELSTDELLKRLELKRRMREELDLEKLEDERLTARVQSLKNFEEEEAEKAATREYCSHNKERDMGPAIAGQRDQNGNIQFICLFCQKTWLNFGDGRDPSRLPPHLHISQERIGGVG